LSDRTGICQSGATFRLCDILGGVSKRFALLHKYTGNSIGVFTWFRISAVR